MDKDSIPAAIYATWERHLKLSVRDRMVPAEARDGSGPPRPVRPRS